jgi:aldose sugar dehydrogenase
MVAGVAALALVTACSNGSSPEEAAPTSSQAAAAPSPTVSPTTEPPAVAIGRTLATGLQVPWGVAFLGDGSALVAQRPTGRVVRVGPGAGGPRAVGTVPGVADQGEGGLLGLAVQEKQGRTTVFAYLTATAGDNRVVSMPLRGGRLGRPEVLLKGIPSAGVHNGGLLTIGPDEKLWIGTGEAGRRAPAQDRSDLGGKVLRIDTDGSVPADNPFPGSPVYSLGHRNVQGLAFDSIGQPWAVEFGQNTWDELNRLVPGGNFGWPTVEGKAKRKGFIDPVVQWHTDEASPSGMAIVDDVAYIGGLKGERLWQVPLRGTGTGTPKAWLKGDLGRIRNVVAAPGGGLWVTTSNRDGRGSPGTDDDRVVQISLR